MTVVDSLKRLERAGSEESRATRKLVDAARALSDHIVDYLPDDVMEYPNNWACGAALPRQYGVAGHPTNDGGCILAFADPDNGYSVVDGDRESALAFARDIATGWLDELATWLEERTAKADESTTTLKTAAEARKQ